MGSTLIKVNNVSDQKAEYAFFGANISVASSLGATQDIAAVRVATISPINLFSINLSDPAFDGVTLSIGDRVLVRAQNNSANNGIGVISQQAGSNIITRASDYDSDAEVNNNDLIPVSEGNTYAGQTFRLTTEDPITVGTTALNFELHNESMISIDNRSFDEMQRESRTKPFTMNHLKIKFDNANQVTEPVYISHKSMSGVVLDKTFYPIEYMNQFHSRNDFVDIRNINAEINGSVTIRGTILANTLMVFIPQYTLIPMAYELNEFSKVHFLESKTFSNIGR